MKWTIAALAIAGLALTGCASPASDAAPAQPHGHGSLSVFQEDYVPSDPHGNGSLSPFLEDYASLPEVGNPGLTEFYLDVHEPVEAELSVFEHLLNDYLPEEG